MNMVFNASDNDRLALQIRQDAAKVAMCLLAKATVAQIRATVLG
jgi:hypothetical protein